MDTSKNLVKLYSLIKPNLKKLEYPIEIKGKKLHLYGAGRRLDGKRDYYRIFPRDSFLSAFLLKDTKFLKDLLIFCIEHQGKKYNSKTGEEPGKIPHEYPGVMLRGLSTEYNAADTTPLFLIGFYEYFSWTGDINFLKKHTKSINSALSYVLKHVKDGIFWEDPKYSGARRFALKITYWRDRGVIKRKNREVAWPAAYSLLQAQIANALRCAVKLPVKLDFDKEYLQSMAKNASRAIFTRFWDNKLKCPAVCIDRKGKIAASFSDGLHMLYYLKHSDISQKKLRDIFKMASSLETPFGYLTYKGKERLYSEKVWDNVIWPFEQAYIALGCSRFGLKNAKQVTVRTINALAQFNYPFSEAVNYNNGKVRPLGCHIQLWTIAYLTAMKSLYTT